MRVEIEETVCFLASFLYGTIPRRLAYFPYPPSGQWCSVNNVLPSWGVKSSQGCHEWRGSVWGKTRSCDGVKASANEDETSMWYGHLAPHAYSRMRPFDFSNVYGSNKSVLAVLQCPSFISKMPLGLGTVDQIQSLASSARKAKNVLFKRVNWTVSWIMHTCVSVLVLQWYHLGKGRFDICWMLPHEAVMELFAGTWMSSQRYLPIGCWRLLWESRVHQMYFI